MLASNGEASQILPCILVPYLSLCTEGLLEEAVARATVSVLEGDSKKQLFSLGDGFACFNYV